MSLWEVKFSLESSPYLGGYRFEEPAPLGVKRLPYMAFRKKWEDLNLLTNSFVKAKYMGASTRKHQGVEKKRCEQMWR